MHEFVCINAKRKYTDECSYPPQGQYKSVTDPGKNAAAGTSGDYRRIATATGPAATKGTYTATLDPGKQASSTAAGSPSDFYSTHAKNSNGDDIDPTPQESHEEHHEHDGHDHSHQSHEQQQDDE